MGGRHKLRSCANCSFGSSTTYARVDKLLSFYTTVNVRIDTGELSRDAEAELRLAQTKYAETIKSIEALEKLVARTSQAGVTRPNSREAKRSTYRPKTWNGLRQLVLKFANSKPDDFTLQDVVEYVAEQGETLPTITRKAISTVMSSMCNTNQELVVIREGFRNDSKHLQN